VSFAQARKVAALSWPLYAFGAGVIVVSVFVLSLRVPVVAKLFATLAIIVMLRLSFASFFAFHAMFDHSDLLSGSWLHAVVPAPQRWSQITTSLEQTTLPLDRVFPDATGSLIDVYDPNVMTEPALARARRGRGVSDDPPLDDLHAVESESSDLVVIMLAAHEIRSRKGRESLFNEVRRIVAPQGRVVLVEHLRDFIAAITFGPGLFHFFPRREWIDLTCAAFELEKEFPITSFVRVFVLRPRTH